MAGDFRINHRENIDDCQNAKQRKSVARPTRLLPQTLKAKRKLMDISKKGFEGEQALNIWLKKNGLSYLYIDQSIETFATLFTGNLKRPDFLILLESIGMIAVDAKNYQLSGGVYTLSLENEFQKALSFERVFRIPLWYAYKGEEAGEKIWFWISALKAIEVGKVRQNSTTGDKFLAIRVEHFEKIVTNQDLGKLYTHRLPSIEKIPTIPVESSHLDIGRISFVTQSNHELEFDKIYGFSSNYDGNRINSVINRLTQDVEFNINYRRGEDDYFSTRQGKVDRRVVALIDYMSTQILYEADYFTETVTCGGQNTTEALGFVIDHLIYAVSSVFYDDKSQAWYEIYIDDKKLTQKGREVINRLRSENYSIDVGMYNDYALFANLA